MRYWLLSFLLLFSVSLSFGQETTTYLQLKTDTTALETGQRYTIRLEVQDIEALWAADIRIAYDPSQLYVIGTESGSPIRIGEFLQGGDTIFNSVDDSTGEIRYAFSIFSPANPVSGTGIIGSFEIVPLLAGTSQLRFTTAQLSSVEFILDASGQRVGGNAVEINFLPVLLEAVITGDPATPPSEATATPRPTATLDPALIREENTEVLEPTLVNVTAAPSTSNEIVEVETSSPLLFIGIGLAIVAGIGLLNLFILSRRQR